AGRVGCDVRRDATRRTGTYSLSAVDAYTPWSEVKEDPPVSSDRERLVIPEDGSPAARESSLSSLGALSTLVLLMTAGTKDSTSSSDPSDPSDITDPSDNSDPTNTRRSQAQDAKRIISSIAALVPIEAETTMVVVPRSRGRAHVTPLSTRLRTFSE
ncbi:unnamed protein product, partial [Ixodes persulcatus]